MSGLRQEWLNDKEFSGWLSGVPGDYFFYCKLCRKEINLHGKSSLRSHANGVKHSDLVKELKRKRRKPPSRPPAAKKPLSHYSSNAGVNINISNVPSTSTARRKAHKEYCLEQFKMEVQIDPSEAALSFRSLASTQPSSPQLPSSGTNNNIINVPSTPTGPGIGVRHADEDEIIYIKEEFDALEAALSSRSPAITKRSTSHQSSNAGTNISVINVPSTSTGTNMHQTTSPDYEHVYSTFSSRMPPSTCAQSLGDFDRERSPSADSVSQSSPSLGYDGIKRELKKTIREMFNRQKVIIETDISYILNKYKEKMSSDDYSVIQSNLDRYNCEANKLMQDRRKDLLHCYILRYS